LRKSLFSDLATGGHDMISHLAPRRHAHEAGREEILEEDLRAVSKNIMK